MSNKINGVVFEASEEQAVDFFCNLEPKTFLKLTLLDGDDLWGISAEGWPGDAEILDEIARLVSVVTGIGYRVCYHSAVGFCDSLYKEGKCVHTMDPDTPNDMLSEGASRFFGRVSKVDETIEVVCSGRGTDDWVLEIVPGRPG